MALNFFYYSNSESFDRYLKEIAGIPHLSEEDEKALGVEAKKGNLEARDILVNSLLKFVVSIARNYKNRGVALEDLVSEGNIGLLYAVEGFDPNEGRLSTYSSYWIKKAINDAIREKTGITHTDTPTDRFENYRTRIKEKLNSASVQITDNEDGSIIFETKTHSAFDCRRWILEKTPFVKVIEPEWMKEEVKTALEEGLKN